MSKVYRSMNEMPYASVLSRLGRVNRDLGIIYQDRTRESFDDTSHSLSILHWFWNTPEGLVASLEDNTAREYASYYQAALRTIKSHVAAVYVDGIAFTQDEWRN
jgi:hypothetical protein